MDMRNAFPGKTMKATEMLGQVQILTISAVTMETVGEDQKPVIHFYEAEQGLVMNKTKNETLMGVFGAESAGWVGQQIQLSTGKTSYQGKVVDCIDVSLPGTPVAAPVAIPGQPGLLVASVAPPVAPVGYAPPVAAPPAYAAPVAPVAPVAPGSVPPPAPMAPPPVAAVPPAPAAPVIPGQILPGQVPPGYTPPPQ